MAVGTLKITHGLPGSGKSTFAEKDVATDPTNIIRANRDDIRTQLFGSEYHKGKPDPKSENMVTHVQTKLIKEGLAAGKTVWVDDTNINARRLKSLFELGKGHKVEQFYFNVPVNECIRRNKLRGEVGGREVPEYVIRKMAKNAYDDYGNIKEFKQDSRGLVHAIPRQTKGSVKIDEYNKTLEKNKVKGNAIVLVDVDGTLINNGHIANIAFSNPKKKNYPMFFRSVNTAPHNPEVVKLANSMHDNDDLNIVILTGRDDEYAEELIDAVEKSGIKAYRIIAKKKGDYRPDFDVKKEVVEDLKKEGFVPVHSIDDREQSVKMYENMGILVSQVKEYKRDPSRTSTEPYATPPVTTIYGSGLCLRCGKPIKNGNIGPICRNK